MTVHRRENWGENLQNICLAIKNLLIKFPNLFFLIPMHPNQIVRDGFLKTLKNEKKVNLIEPMEYPELIGAMNTCKLILTDSGGIQEEAPSLGKPVLVLRDTTERPEGIDAGTAKLVGSKPEVIEEEVEKLLTYDEEYQKMSKVSNPYGDGKASERIYRAIIDEIN